MNGKSFFKTLLFWKIIGVFLLILVSLWFYFGQKDEGFTFNQADLNKQTTAPTAEDKINSIGDKKLIKQLEAPIVAKDALSREESARLL